MKAFEEYNARLETTDKVICDALLRIISDQYPEYEAKIWHGHPVWFIEGNPIAGYHKLKHSVRLLFWSGQSFETPGLVPEGKFKAAEKRFTDLSEINEEEIRNWLQEATIIQWDYKNIVKRKGKLERLK